MKIISKYKDYYDYLQGINGIDEKIILNRTEGVVIDLSYVKQLDHFDFSIFGRRVRMIKWKNGWTTPKQLAELGWVLDTSDYKDNTISSISEKSKLWWKREEDKEYFHNLKSIDYCPIVLIKSKYNKQIVKWPRLLDFQIGKIISPQDMWINLYNWMSVKEEPKNNQTDKEKIISHGMDIKTSFRPKIKL